MELFRGRLARGGAPVAAEELGNLDGPDWLAELIMERRSASVACSACEPPYAAAQCTVSGWDNGSNLRNRFEGHALCAIGFAES